MSLRLEKSVRDVVPRIPPDLHAARRRDHALPEARPRVHRAGGARGGGGRRWSRPAARRVRRRPGPGRPGRCHRRRADLARRRGRRLGHLGRVRAPRQAVDRAWVRADRARHAGRPGRLRLRDRDHRAAAAGPAPARAAVRPAGSPDAPVTDGRIVVDGRPVPFEAGDSVAVAILRAGEVPGRGGTLCLAGDCGNCLAQVDGVAYVRTCQTAARPGLRVARHPVGAMPALPVVVAADLTSTPLPVDGPSAPSRGRCRGRRRRVERSGRGGRCGARGQVRSRPRRPRG